MILKKQKSEHKKQDYLTWWHIIEGFLLLIVFASLTGLENREIHLNKKIETLQMEQTHLKAEITIISSILQNVTISYETLEHKTLIEFENLYGRDQLKLIAFEKLNKEMIQLRNMNNDLLMKQYSLQIMFDTLNETYSKKIKI